MGNEIGLSNFIKQTEINDRKLFYRTNFRS